MCGCSECNEHRRRFQVIALVSGAVVENVTGGGDVSKLWNRYCLVAVSGV